MHKILLEDEVKPTIEHQRRLNSTMKEVVRKEVLKWLDAGVIYPISNRNLIKTKYANKIYIKHQKQKIKVKYHYKMNVFQKKY